MAGFSVDTKLFRELGELLVGRDSTALVELIKNAYDADATEVVVEGHGLDHPETAIITVNDDGVGMDLNEFSAGFLTIGGRTKVEGDRRSRWFHRRFTGEKGVGRLAAHKLGRKLTVVSRRWDRGPRVDISGFPAKEGVRAVIDWDEIERLETIAQIEGSNAVSLERLAMKQAGPRWAGTKLTIAPLRKAWAPRDIDRFFSEVATLTPPEPLTTPLPGGLIKAAPLLSKIDVRDSDGGEDSFTITYAGDLRKREPEVPVASANASWVIEIDYDGSSKILAVMVAPTSTTLSEFPMAQALSYRRKVEDLTSVSFQARIFQKNGADWPSAYSGVRVFHEGFRVLPYGDPHDDWLGLDRDYRSRGKGELGRLRRYASWDLPGSLANEALVIQGNTHLFGGVFLTREKAAALKMLVNREGFLPSPELEGMVELLRLGIDLQVRQRYAASSPVKEVRKQERERKRQGARSASPYQTPSAFLMESVLNEASGDLGALRVEMQHGRVAKAMAIIGEIDAKITEASSLAGDSSSDTAMFRILASIGLEQAAFVHEVNSLALLSQGVAEAVGHSARQARDAATGRALSRISADAREIRERLRRNAIYLADMTGIEGRRRRSRQKIAAVFESVLEHFERIAKARSIVISSFIPPTLDTLPMFPAELKAIMSNLLSNAVKFAGTPGRISARGEHGDGEAVFRLENTGSRVDPAKGAIWFEPFRSTTHEVNEALGQGMGLGLTITRSMIQEYGGTIAFVSPSPGFATAVEARLPSK